MKGPGNTTPTTNPCDGKCDLPPIFFLPTVGEMVAESGIDTYDKEGGTGERKMINLELWYACASLLVMLPQ